MRILLEMLRKSLHHRDTESTEHSCFFSDLCVSVGLVSGCKHNYFSGCYSPSSDDTSRRRAR